MKNCKKLKKDFIKKCKDKYDKSGKTYKEIASSVNMGERTVKEFFEYESNAKIDTVIKILNSLDLELKV